MGTRADFYIGKGKNAEWIGSVAWDGYQWGERIESNDNDEITAATTDQEYREAVTNVVEGRDDGTTAEMGWPWPWDNSCTTDCAYCFVDGKVEAFSWGCDWSDESMRPEWPDMSTQNSAEAGSDRSGIILFSG